MYIRVDKKVLITQYLKENILSTVLVIKASIAAILCEQYFNVTVTIISKKVEVSHLLKYKEKI